MMKAFLLYRSNLGQSNSDLLNPAVQKSFVDEVLSDFRKRRAEATETGDEETFEMANIRPEKTGLPFIVYISEKGRAKHDVRVKVSPAPRVREFVATVSVRPDVRVIEGNLSANDLALLSKWIELNRDVIIRYWDGDILYTEDALAALVPLP